MKSWGTRLLANADSLNRFQGVGVSWQLWRVLAGAVLFVHLLWCMWVLLGWIVTHRHPLLRTLHIASLLYAIVIELIPWPPCPLTWAETWLEARAGIEPAHGPFLVRVLDSVVYPDLPKWLVVGGAVIVCVAILCVYLRRYLRRCRWAVVKPLWFSSNVASARECRGPMDNAETPRALRVRGERINKNEACGTW